MEKSLIAQSPVIKDLLTVLQKASVSSSPVLFTGELGSGMTTFAKVISDFRDSQKSFFKVNCAELNDFSEIDFLHVDTIYFSHVECLLLPLQEKLLELCKTQREFKIIASSTDELAGLVEDKKFLEELFFRLNVFSVRIPPLRVRQEDIVPLANQFLLQFACEYNKKGCVFSDEAVLEMRSYRWPGNVQELYNVVSRAVLCAETNVITLEDLHLQVNQYNIDVGFSKDAEDRTLKTKVNDFKRRYIIRILDECGWNQTKAGKILGIQRTYVSRLMNELNIRER